MSRGLIELVSWLLRSVWERESNDVFLIGSQHFDLSILEGRYYFDRQENLTKLLQSLAQDAPQNQVEDLIRHRLREMFKATRKTCYDDVLPLPRLEEVADRVRKGRVLLVVNPDSKIPPD
ncbi:MAG: hypothetical protein LH613_18145 [Chamaesiphon sp.]|nr:hypothetical protein [Chamaesiphon sp.]